MDRSDKKTSLYAAAAVAAITAACLILFTSKAFNIDDTLFLWSAKQILSYPLDFYGFSGNWANVTSPAVEIIKNPPLASYYIAFVSLFAGFGERGLHLAFIVPAAASALGAYILASRLTRLPFLAALAGVFTPVFLVSANTVMSDVMMLAFFIWAVVLWMRGLERDGHSSFFFAGAFISLAALTKYFAVSLIPLLVVYAIVSRPRSFKWAMWICLPIAVLAVYQYLTGQIYGKGLFLDATIYASKVSGEGVGGMEKTFVALIFTGGCLLTTLFYAPLLWGKRWLAAGSVAIAAAALVLTRVEVLSGAPLVAEDGYRWDMIIQAGIFVVAGIGIFALAVSDLLRRRDKGALLLFMWVAGTFVFATYFNWTVNARALLPIAPALGILVMRRLETRSALIKGWRLAIPLVPAVILSLLVAWADYDLAGSARKAASDITARYNAIGRTVWFEGHWGFQYYMEARGAKAIDLATSVIMPGDIIVFPHNNVNLWFLPKDKTRLVETVVLDAPRLVATMTLGPGAGFYASEWGPLPYMTGRLNKETYWVMEATDEIRFRQD